MELIGLGIAVASGMEARRIIVLLVLLVAPLFGATFVLILILRSRTDRAGRSAAFCEGVASELRAGAPLAAALHAAATATGVTTLADVTSARDLAVELARHFPDIAHELVATVHATARAGSGVAGLFDEIGALAIAQDEVTREVRVASSPARATALVFLGAPTIFLIFKANAGELGRLVSDPGQRAAVVAGLVLFVAGFLFAAFMLWRAR